MGRIEVNPVTRSGEGINEASALEPRLPPDDAATFRESENKGTQENAPSA